MSEDILTISDNDDSDDIQIDESKSVFKPLPAVRKITVTFTKPPFARGIIHRRQYHFLWDRESSAKLVQFIPPSLKFEPNPKPAAPKPAAPKPTPKTTSKPTRTAAPKPVRTLAPKPQFTSPQKNLPESEMVEDDNFNVTQYKPDAEDEIPDLGVDPSDSLSDSDDIWS